MTKKVRAVFLDRACLELGFCLSAGNRQRILAQGSSPETIVDAVIAADGLDPDTCTHKPANLALWHQTYDTFGDHPK